MNNVIKALRRRQKSLKDFIHANETSIRAAHRQANRVRDNSLYDWAYALRYVGDEAHDIMNAIDELSEVNCELRGFGETEGLYIINKEST